MIRNQTMPYTWTEVEIAQARMTDHVTRQLAAAGLKGVGGTWGGDVLSRMPPAQ